MKNNFDLQYSIVKDMLTGSESIWKYPWYNVDKNNNTLATCSGT